MVDLLHEFELGVWKAVMIHLVRMLHSISLGTVNEMDSRYDISLSLVSLFILMKQVID